MTRFWNNINQVHSYWKYRKPNNCRIISSEKTNGPKDYQSVVSNYFYEKANKLLRLVCNY